MVYYFHTMTRHIKKKDCLTHSQWHLVRWNLYNAAFDPSILSPEGLVARERGIASLLGFVGFGILTFLLAVVSELR